MGDRQKMKKTPASFFEAIKISAEPVNISVRRASEGSSSNEHYFGRHCLGQHFFSQHHSGQH